MLDIDAKRRIDACRDVLVGKVPDPKSQVEQITIALIYKFMNDMDLKSEEMGGKRSFFTEGYEQYRWSNLVAPGISGKEMLETYTGALREMVKNQKLPEFFRDIFRNAFLPYHDPETLRLFLREIDEFTYDHHERLGDAYEYLLSMMDSQGGAGQFRTPRHIIEFMVDIIDPQKDEVVVDPACGTAGFLISAYKHVLKHNSRSIRGTPSADKASSASLRNGPTLYSGDMLTHEERITLANNLRGYDISPDMVRLSLVNLYLHDLRDPNIEEYDTLTSESKWSEFADVILANPPFMSPKGGIQPHTKFQIKSTRSEVLFVDYIAEHLAANGRAAVVVPEGIIFNSGRAYIALRKMLVDKFLASVISLPQGVFNPYSGVKTSILIFDMALVKKCPCVSFFKVENDGFNLGSQRKPQSGSQLPQLKEDISRWLDEARSGRGDVLDSTLGFCVNRETLLSDKEITLNAGRYISRDIGKSDFPMISLGDKGIFRVEGGGTPKSNVSEYWDGDISWITLADLLPDMVITEIYSSVRTISKTGLKNSSAKLIPENSVLISSRATIGRIAVNRVPLATNQGFKNIILLDESSVIADYVAFALTKLVPTMKEIATGGTFAEISKSKFCELEIPLPPIEVQRDVVSEVKACLSVIRGAKATISNYRSKVVVDLDWPVVPLRDVAKVNPGKRELRDFDKNMEVTFVSMSDLNENHPNFLSDSTILLSQKESGNSYFKSGDLLIAKLVSCFEKGKAGIAKNLVNSIGLGSSEFYVIRSSDKVIPEWLFYWLTTSDFRTRAVAKVTGTTLQRIPRSVFENEVIPLPDLHVQREIVGEMSKEQSLVDGNRIIVELFEQRIDKIIAHIWGNQGT